MSQAETLTELLEAASEWEDSTVYTDVIVLAEDAGFPDSVIQQAVRASNVPDSSQQELCDYDTS